MTSLTTEQINEIIDWMNEWEQLRDTVIPLRFKEEFSKSENQRQSDEQKRQSIQKILWENLKKNIPPITTEPDIKSI